MNKVAAYLQEHLDGEVLTSSPVRNYFSTDASVLTIMPNMVVYPNGTNDVRKVMRFCWQLAERGHVLPVTARGRGTDLSGAAIGSGVILAFPAHMNQLLELDSKQGLARIQPGLNYRTMQDVLKHHGRYMAPYPASADYSTIGGAIANNSAGEKSVKYGDTRRYVDRLEVVLANGELIQTARINKRELNRKMGGTTFEADIYRQLDGIITDNWELIRSSAKATRVSKNSSGYDLADVKRDDGSFDLTPLMVGSQGTLGIVVEAIMKLETLNQNTSLIVAEFSSLETAHDAITELVKLQPSALEMVDRHLIEFVEKERPHRFKDLLKDPKTAIVLLIEFDDTTDRTRRRKTKKAEKSLRNLATGMQKNEDSEEQTKLWKLRHSAATVTNYSENGKSALPIIEDGIVPQDQFQIYIEGIYDLFAKARLQVALWGHAGDANIHVQPLLDLAKLVDRQKALKLMEDYYALVLKLGGSISGEHNDGRLRAPFIQAQFGEEMVEVFKQVRKVFDPHGTLNPGVKEPSTLKDLSPLLRKDYSLSHLGDHLPQI